MARLPRLNLPGVPQHIIQRGNNREVCFFDEKDYPVYLSKLEEYSRKLNVSIHAFVLMTNHVHLLATPEEGEGVSRLMQSLGRYYVRTLIRNTVAQVHCGKVVTNQHLLIVTYLLTVSRYIELNPVRADMVEQPGEYPWSSFRRNALGIPIKLITPHEVYTRLAKTNKTREKRYLALFDKELKEYTLEEIRSSVNRAWVLGSRKFKDQVEKKTGRQASPAQRGGDRKSESYRKKNQLLSGDHRFFGLFM